MAYTDFLEEINKSSKALFDEISTEFNFDNGHEFEIALCKFLRILLPRKYGVCRGYVVDKDGNTAGDDIIIFDQERFPSLRLLQNKDYGNKEKIPAEAVYAYIEAKHTLCLEGNGGQSLYKALQQINNIKNIHREKLPLTFVTPQVSIASHNPNRPSFWPDYYNPLYTAIISRNVRIKQTDPISDENVFYKTFREKCNQITADRSAPDLIIAGSNVIALPGIGSQVESPFYIAGKSTFGPLITKERAFSAGLTLMLYAFDHIMLGNIYWPAVISYATSLELVNNPK